MLPIKIISISGSLRKTSRNTSLLKAVRELAPMHIEVCLFDQLAQIPPFNSDLEVDNVTYVAHLRDEILRADGVLIASPEYAHGVSGVLKNALDWMVVTEAFINKPVAMLNAAPRAHHAYDSLKETLILMSSIWVEAASITVPIIDQIETTENIVADAVISQALQQALAEFHSAIIEQSTIRNVQAGLKRPAPQFDH